MRKLKHSTTSIKKATSFPFALLPLSAAIAMQMVSPLAMAKFSDLQKFQNAYPNSTSNGASCSLCHTNDTDFMNTFSQAYANNGRSFTGLAVATLDSDGDPTGSTDLVEINAGTQPGWTTGGNNNIYLSKGNGNVIRTEAAPSNIGPLDPAAAPPPGNQAPIATLNAATYTGVVNQPLTFDATGSTDDGTIVTYQWDYGDNTTPDTTTTPTTTHNYTTTGPYTVSLTVTDDLGLTSSAATANVSIANGQVIPTAVLTVAPPTGLTGSTFVFDGSGSTDDSVITTYSWDYGNDTSDTSLTPTISYAYPTSGIYNATLTVTDDDNNVDMASVSITVTDNMIPTAGTDGPYTGNAGDLIAMTAAGSSDPEGGPLTYSWDYGDNSPVGTDASVTYTYASDGIYNIELTVTDDQGQTAIANTIATIGQVTNPAPVILPVGPYMGTTLAPVSLSATATDDDGIASYVWDYGDGSATEMGQTVSHQYQSVGTFNVKLTVTDNLGQATKTSTTVNIGIGNIAPTADAGGPYTAITNQSVTLDGSNSTDADGAISYSWDYGDGTALDTVAMPSHTYTKAGMYNASLIVTDSQGLTSTDNIVVTVTDAASDPDPTPDPTPGSSTSGSSDDGGGGGSMGFGIVGLLGLLGATRRKRNKVRK
jgi:PKD repeat protein